MSKQKKAALLIVQIVFYIIVVWFISQSFNELRGSINVDTVLNNPLYIFLSATFFLLFYGILSMHWKKICDNYSKFPQKQQWLSFFASQPYKYLPSSIFTFSSRAVYAKKLGLPIKQSSLTQLIENFNILLSGFCISIVFILFDTLPGAGIFLFLVCVLLLLGIYYLVPKIKIPKSEYEIAGKEWVALFLLCLFAWMLAGVSFYFMVLSSGQTTAYASAIGVNSLAMGLGILTIFAPGGIGVRELVYSKFNIGNAAIIMWRLLTLVIDVIVGITAIIIINTRHYNPNKISKRNLDNGYK